MIQLSLFQPGTTAVKPAGPSLGERMKTILGPRLPVAALEDAVMQIMENPISLKVVGHRTSKSGDFRAARKNIPACITVNGNLNPYAFLITLVHEIAHHHVNTDHAAQLRKFTFRRKSRPLPHGREWKEKFRSLMGPFLNRDVFPDDIFPVLVRYLESPKASSSADHDLSRVLKRYDGPDSTRRLEELVFDAVFTLNGRKTFRKKERIRTRYRCICMKISRIYLVSAGAPVIPL